MSSRVTRVLNADVPFYQSVKYSTWVLTTGQTGFTPFAGVEASNLRYYNVGQNLFFQNQGRVLALKATLSGPSFGRLNLQDSAGALAIADSAQALFQQARIVISQDSQIVHEDLLRNLIQPLPLFANPIVTGTPVNAYGPIGISSSNDSSAMIKRAQKPGVYFTPPMFVAQGRNISFQVVTPTGYSIPANLNTYNLQFILVTEELPQSNLAQVRT